ncbi:NUDIX hydrolase [Streptomyces gilvosporeus]|uniref:Hydrolase n=1 Tax=Streptomyces gilvosporeus TaxID=553510 RepID=A0A1V0TV86_9ACTN|nr:NUDIX hydrolase [Streptomyces gilvosporeus]ARF56864.1 hydrolase [Streptomyces gilvosporeus]
MPDAMPNGAARGGGGAPNGAAGGAAGAPIRAAGCVLWRRSAASSAPGGDGLEIALVHRPKYDDWSHPKGKLKRAEDALVGAVREVAEETGMTCTVGPELPTVRYLVGNRPKVVRYWAAEATGGTFTPNREVDRLLWAAPDTARRYLTQDRDKDLVAALLSALPRTGEGR